MFIEEGPPPLPPHHCAVTQREDGEFIDLGVDIEGLNGPQHLYLKRDWLEQEAVESLGMVPSRQFEELKARVEEYGAKVDAALARLGELEDVEEELQKIANPIPQEIS